MREVNPLCRLSDTSDNSIRPHGLRNPTPAEEPEPEQFALACCLIASIRNRRETVIEKKKVLHDRPTAIRVMLGDHSQLSSKFAGVEHA